jgi:hypothetical protein
MEKLLTDFNRSTENIKVFLRIRYNDDDDDSHQEQTINIWRRPKKQKKPSMQYSLEFCRLSPIHDSVRNAPGCTAEIVHLDEEEQQCQREADCEAVLLGTTTDIIHDDDCCCCCCCCDTTAENSSRIDSESRPFSSSERENLPSAEVTEIVGPDGRTQRQHRSRRQQEQHEQSRFDCYSSGIQNGGDIVEATSFPTTTTTTTTTVLTTPNSTSAPVAVAVSIDNSQWIHNCHQNNINDVTNSHLPLVATAEIVEISSSD